MYVVQIHRNQGQDEDFEVETHDDAVDTAEGAIRQPDTRRVVILNPLGEIIEEL